LVKGQGSPELVLDYGAERPIRSRCLGTVEGLNPMHIYPNLLCLFPQAPPHFVKPFCMFFFCFSCLYPFTEGLVHSRLLILCQLCFLKIVFCLILCNPCLWLHSFELTFFWLYASQPGSLGYSVILLEHA